MSKGTPKANAIEQAISVLADPIFRALAEPSRLAVLKRVLQVERADIAEIAAGLPQERSVVSRHLQGLHDAGILRAERVSRQVYYQVDGPRWSHAWSRSCCRSGRWHLIAAPVT